MPPADLTDENLAEMSFHDVRVLGFAAMPDNFEMRFDIDYIVEWLCPPQRPGPISFRVSPATLVFEHAGDIEAHLKMQQGEFSIDDLVRSDFQQLPSGVLGTWQYEMRGHEECVLRLRASGFKLFFRAAPVLSRKQALSMRERGGISFEVPA